MGGKVHPRRRLPSITVDVKDLQARYKHYLPVANGCYMPSITITVPKHQGISMSDEQLEMVKMLHRSDLALSDALPTLKAKRSGDQTRAYQINSLLNLADGVCLKLAHLARQEATQGKLRYTEVTRALAFALEQLVYDLHDWVTTDKLDLRQRKKIRKRRNKARKRATLGQLRERNSEAAVRFSTNPGDIANIYRSWTRQLRSYEKQTRTEN
ncbi:hypothetical protein FNAPI_7497 [Fusarium napiforme]|uniref:Uncharacterized protein n=1 Tax=Fusarium napiforme TaxID=42672 RepID=A0A8H5J932_9HYPO|nr:hypothetical protein FNAPI_7497 [Fusarium napiforme]